MKGKRKIPILIKKTSDAEPVGPANINSLQESSIDAFGTDFEGGGYIIDQGNIIPIDLPALESVNKFALNVIQHTITENYDQNVDDDTNFMQLRSNLLSALEKNATTN